MYSIQLIYLCQALFYPWEPAMGKTQDSSIMMLMLHFEREKIIKNA